jgi:hypothetical protein
MNNLMEILVKLWPVILILSLVVVTLIITKDKKIK